jgi:hypothetical protein
LVLISGLFEGFTSLPSFEFGYRCGVVLVDVARAYGSRNKRRRKPREHAGDIFAADCPKNLQRKGKTKNGKRQ